MAYVYTATLLRVVDGDTIVMSVQLTKTRAFPRDLGFHVHFEDGYVTVHESLRLVGLNAPEHGSTKGDAATVFVRQWFAEHPGPHTVVTSKDKQEKYGRFLADVRTRTKPVVSLNEQLLATGHAMVWDGSGTRPV